ncbi:hypothetical protein BBAD15_g8372 [Beauveria bassiana D1-5]|uniref:Peptidase S1 domain-containing protein n=1 Tax=Beauveria bassiana D1-5 TaxID=1245745 RepID=A0A0A2VFG2_BEABA|nr:hypothetical protein BBAD15_g8372 [Beauveria bassiana D1-5]
MAALSASFTRSRSPFTTVRCASAPTRRPAAGTRSCAPAARAFPFFDAATGTLIGIASWVPKDKNGNECDQAPNIFTRVGSYIPWIKANLGGGVGQLPAAEEVWIRNATSQMGGHCSRFMHEDPDNACNEASVECLKEMPQGTPETELLQCVDRKEACAGQKCKPSKHSQCIEKAKVCVKEKDIQVGSIKEIQECALKNL